MKSVFSGKLLLFFHPLNKRFRSMFEAWHRLNLRAHAFEYSNCGPVPRSCELNGKNWIDNLKFYHSLNMMGFGLVTRVPDGNYKGGDPLPR